MATASLKISELPSASTLSGTEVVPVVQGGVTKKAAVSTLAESALGNFKKWGTEKIYSPFSIHADLMHHDPSVWNASDPDSYRPTIDLSAITGSQVIHSTGTSSGLNLSPITRLVAPDWVDIARARKRTIREGMTSPKSDFTLASYQVTSNVLTLTFATDTDLTAMLANINEWALVEGASADLVTYTADYTRVGVINIPTNLGAVAAGDYVMSSVTASSKQVTIPYTTGNISLTSTSVQCAFYPHRISGSTDSARITAIQGRALVGAGDAGLQYITGGKWRGRGQNHHHQVGGTTGGGLIGIQGVSNVQLLGTFTLDQVLGPTTDATAGTYRGGAEYGIRDIAVNFHMGLGALEA